MFTAVDPRATAPNLPVPCLPLLSYINSVLARFLARAQLMSAVPCRAAMTLLKMAAAVYMARLSLTSLFLAFSFL